MEKKKNKAGKMQKAVLIRTLIPMIIMGFIITISVYIGYHASIKKEVANSMQAVASSVAATYDVMYPGDYVLKGERVVSLYKGDTDITLESAVVDRIKSDSGMDVSIVHGNTRIMTTLKNEYNERYRETGINASVYSSAQKSKDVLFYEVDVTGDDKYYACYLPLYNSDDTYAGVIEVTKPVSEIKAIANKAVIPIAVITVLCMILASAITYKYSNSLVGAMHSICEFLKGMISGDLNNDMPREVTARNDELGVTGKTVVSMQNAIRILVERDPLTTLYNRRYGNAKLRKVQKYANKSGMSYSVALGDIDFFKKVNDTYGHEAGDIVLKRVAEIMKKHMAGKGFVARWGGEEFLLVFDKVGKEGGAKELNDILNQIRRMVIVYNEMTIRVTMSFGVVDGSLSDEFSVLLRKSDDKLYYAKQHGRNQVVSIEIDGLKEEEPEVQEAEAPAAEEPAEPIIVEGTDFSSLVEGNALDKIVNKITDKVMSEVDKDDDED